MRIYEELFIVDPGLPEEEIDAVAGLIEDVVKESGGKVEKVEKWGRRKLAYRIQKKEEGYYVLVQFSASGSAVKEIERRLRVDERVMRYLTVRIDEKLKWLEKRRKQREKRMAKRPPAAQPVQAQPAAAPGAPAPAKPEGGD